MRTLSIVIPALNEEAAITDTVRRCLDARPLLRDACGLQLEIIVVNDGSRDRTEALALGFPEVCVLGFDRNQGYGAAIKTGFAEARGELLAFLDADGTCDPRALADLCRVLDEQQADIVLGSRMGPGNRMPAVRRLGNVAFAWLLGVLSKRRVHDTASGMRLLRREAYAQLLPLPDGLNFTPAMSARALLEGRLRLVETPMPYAERIGRSKLSVLSDGVRFLRSILVAALCYRPARLLLLAAGAMAVAMAAIGWLPLRAYAGAVPLQDWMIYRALLASLLGTSSGLCICAAVVSDRIAAAAHRRSFGATGLTGRLARLFAWPISAIVWLFLGGSAVYLVAPGLAQYVAEGAVTIHWSRPLVASLLLVLAVAHALSTVLLGLVSLIERQARLPQATVAPDRRRPATAAS